MPDMGLAVNDKKQQKVESLHISCEMKHSTGSVMIVPGLKEL